MKVAVLLSGGVDSSVALRLLQRQGHEVTAFYLKIWLQEELAFLGDCPWEEDLNYVRAVCQQAEVPLQIVPLQSEYQERVVSHALEELKHGRTPSPDILCNQQIKFGLFFKAIDPAFEKVASGHYAQIEPLADSFLLKRSPDPVKDQTYFLSRISQTQLSRIAFPIGHLSKKEVRKLASELDLPNRERKDSQGICFLGKIEYSKFVQFHLGEQRGEIIDLDTGKALGYHRGVWFHTVGQRQGLGLGGGPWYVVRKDLSTNRLYISHATRFLEHARQQFVVEGLHWIGAAPIQPNLQVKLRHSPHLDSCRLHLLSETRAEVFLENKDQGVAPGQSAVFYDNDICLGSGVIT